MKIIILSSPLKKNFKFYTPKICLKIFNLCQSIKFKIIFSINQNTYTVLTTLIWQIQSKKCLRQIMSLCKHHWVYRNISVQMACFHLGSIPMPTARRLKTCTGCDFYLTMQATVTQEKYVSKYKGESTVVQDNGNFNITL